MGDEKRIMGHGLGERAGTAERGTEKAILAPGTLGTLGEAPEGKRNKEAIHHEEHEGFKAQSRDTSSLCCNTHVCYTANDGTRNHIVLAV